MQKRYNSMLMYPFFTLTHCGPVTPYIWVNIGSGNGLLSDGITLTSVDFSLVRFWGIHLQAISQEILKIYILDMCLKITTLKPLILDAPW